MPTALPVSALKMITSRMDIKKTWERLHRLSHNLAFALPSIEISNSASPRQLRIKRLVCDIDVHPFGEHFAYGYNTPSMDASLRYLLMESKLRSSIVEDSVMKTSFLLLKDVSCTGIPLQG